MQSTAIAITRSTFQASQYQKKHLVQLDKMLFCDCDRIFTHSTSQEHRLEIAVQTLIERDTKPIEKMFAGQRQ